MDKKAKIASIISIVAVLAVLSLMVFAAPKKCNNGSDDDNDGLVDYPNDPGCSSSTDNTETGTAICDNGVDQTNDADTLADYRLSGGDPGCISATDSSEVDGYCDDTIDNLDADTLADYPNDAACASFSDTISQEIDGPCDDLLDNDNDGFTNYPNDPECTSFASKEGNCADTDGGIVVTVQGTASGSTGGTPYSYTDFCLDSVNLREYRCTFEGNPASADQNCAGNSTTSCSNGACA